MRIGKFLQRAAVLALATSLLLAGCQNEAPVPASSEEEGLLVGFLWQPSKRTVGCGTAIFSLLRQNRRGSMC